MLCFAELCISKFITLLCPWRGVLDTILCERFVSDLRQFFGFLRLSPVSSSIKTDHHDITEILLKVALNPITPAIALLIVHTTCVLSLFAQ